MYLSEFINIMKKLLLVLICFKLSLNAGIGNGLRIDPCIPSAWDEFSAVRKFRGCVFEIQVLNTNHVEKGVARLQFNGETLDSNLIPQKNFEKINKVIVMLG